MYFVGLRYIIVSQCTVQKSYKNKAELRGINFLIPDLDAYSEFQESTSFCSKLNVRILGFMWRIRTLDSRSYSFTLHKAACLKTFFFSVCASSQDPLKFKGNWRNKLCMFLSRGTVATRSKVTLLLLLLLLLLLYSCLLFLIIWI